MKGANFDFGSEENMTNKEKILLLIVVLGFILLWRAENIWRFTAQSKTMFEFCDNTNSILGKFEYIYCGNKAVENYLNAKD